MRAPRLVSTIAVLGTLAAVPSPAMARGYLTQWGCFPGVTSPRSVAVPQDGSRVFVGDSGFFAKTVFQFTPSGRLVKSWTSGPAGEFDQPTVAPIPGGVIVGSWQSRPSVQQFLTDDGNAPPTPTKAWTPPPRGGPGGSPGEPGYFRGVVAIVASSVGGRDFTVFADQQQLGGPVLVAYDLSGVPLPIVGTDRFYPSILLGDNVGVASGGGFLWVAQRNPNRLVVASLDINGNDLVVNRTFDRGDPGGVPLAISSAGDGVWVATKGPNGVHTIQKWTPTGGAGEAYTDADVPGGLGNPRGVASDALGNVYVADMGWGRIVKLGPDGALPATGGGPGTPRLTPDCGPPPPPSASTETAATTPSAPVGSVPARRSLRGSVSRYARVQNVLGYRAVRMRVYCPVDCDVKSEVLLKRRSLGRWIHNVPRGATGRLRLKLNRSSLKQIRKARRGGRRVELAVNLYLVNNEARGTARIRSRVVVR